MKNEEIGHLKQNVNELQNQIATREKEYLMDMEKIKNEKQELNNCLEASEERYQCYYLLYRYTCIIYISLIIAIYYCLYILRLRSVQYNLTTSKENEVISDTCIIHDMYIVHVHVHNYICHLVHVGHHVLHVK